MERNCISVRPLHLHDHALALFASQAEQEQVTHFFILQALQANRKVVVALNDLHFDSVAFSLAKAGVDVPEIVRKGQLVNVRAHDLYMNEGRFEPERLFVQVRIEEERCLAEGFTGLNITGEFPSPADLPTTGVLLDYEFLLGPIFPTLKITALCQYNIWRYREDFLAELANLHPLIIEEGTIRENPYYTN